MVRFMCSVFVAFSWREDKDEEIDQTNFEAVFEQVKHIWFIATTMAFLCCWMEVITTSVCWVEDRTFSATNSRKTTPAIGCN